MHASCDVAVVGAGPAGSMAALELTRGGLKVMLIEKGEPPRHKTCGGGLLGRTMKLLPCDIRDVLECECFTAELHHHEPAMHFAASRHCPMVTMVMRDKFDELLTRSAAESGTELLTRTTVNDLTVRPDAVELRTSSGTITARMVVAADGAGSVVARKCGLPELRHVIPALECEVTPDATDFERFRHAARFDFGLTPHGYAWVFPKRDHLSIGVLTTRRGSCNLNTEYTRYLAQLGLTGALKEERHGYMIPVRPRESMFEIPRVFLTGDAAGLVDPVTAEGISAAILSGQLAARAILQSPLDEKAARRAYQQSLEEFILPELRIARILARVLYDFPRVRATLFSRHGQRLSEYLTRVVMGEASYREAVFRPLNYLKLFTG